MSKFLIRREENKNMSILHIVNFLTASQVSTIGELAPMVKDFHVRGVDVVIEIPDELDQRFGDVMVSLRYKIHQV